VASENRAHCGRHQDSDFLRQIFQPALHDFLLSVSIRCRALTSQSLNLFDPSSISPRSAAVVHYDIAVHVRHPRISDDANSSDQFITSFPAGMLSGILKMQPAPFAIGCVVRFSPAICKRPSILHARRVAWNVAEIENYFEQRNRL